MDIYTLFKFLHIVAVIVWVGGAFTLEILMGRVGREGNPAAQGVLARQAAFFGQRVFGPASGAALIAGLVMVFTARISFTTLWILWGLIAMLVTGFLGGSMIRRTGERLAALTASGTAREPEVVALRQRMRTLGTVNLLILLSAVFAMVAKPTL